MQELWLRMSQGADIWGRNSQQRKTNKSAKLEIIVMNQIEEDKIGEDKRRESNNISIDWKNTKASSIEMSVLYHTLLTFHSYWVLFFEENWKYPKWISLILSVFLCYSKMMKSMFTLKIVAYRSILPMPLWEIPTFFRWAFGFPNRVETRT